MKLRDVSGSYVFVYFHFHIDKWSNTNWKCCGISWMQLPRYKLSSDFLCLDGVVGVCVYCLNFFVVEDSDMFFIVCLVKIIKNFRFIAYRNFNFYCLKTHWRFVLMPWFRIGLVFCS